MEIFTTGELATATVQGALSTGVATTIAIYDAQTGASIPLTSAACVEIGTTGIFYFALSNITTQPVLFTQYVFQMTNGVDTTLPESFRVGGYPDLIAPTGDNLLTLTIEDQNTAPIPDVNVTIYDVTKTIPLQTGTTGPSGTALFNLNATDYKVVLQKNQVNFDPVEDLTIIAGANAQTYSGATVTVNVPVDPSTCRVFGFAKTQSGGQTLDAFTGTAEIKELPFSVNNLYHEGDKVIGTYSGTTGEFYWILPQGASVYFKVKEVGINKSARIPAAPTVEISSLS